MDTPEGRGIREPDHTEPVLTAEDTMPLFCSYTDHGQDYMREDRPRENREQKYRPSHRQ